MIAAGAVSMICACGDDAASNNATDPNLDPGANVIDNPYSSAGVTDPSNPGNTQNPGNAQNPTSSAGGANLTDPTNPGNTQNPASSAGVTGPTNPTSSTGTAPLTSSGSVNTDPELGPDGFPTLESYGAPPAEYTKDISATAIPTRRSLPTLALRVTATSTMSKSLPLPWVTSVRLGSVTTGPEALAAKKRKRACSPARTWRRLP